MPMRYNLYRTSHIFPFQTYSGRLSVSVIQLWRKCWLAWKMKMVANQFRFNPKIIIIIVVFVIILIIITLSMGILVQSMSIKVSRSGRFCSWPTPRLCSISWITTPWASWSWWWCWWWWWWCQDCGLGYGFGDGQGEGCAASRGLPRPEHHDHSDGHGNTVGK